MIDVPGLPASVRHRAAALLAGTLEVVPLSDAATVVMLRDGTDGLEVFMQRRTRTLTFAAGMYVFPGGRVEDQDRDPAIPFAGSPPDPAPFATGGDIIKGLPGPSDSSAVYRSLIAAAVRETLEEAGVLLAESADGSMASADSHRVNRSLLAGAPFSAALADVGLRLPFDRLVAFAHWMTPAVEVRRFDTRFFAAVLPQGQQARSASGESDAAGWVRPAVMLERATAGEVVMLPPTVAALSALLLAPDARSVVGAGHRRGLRPVLPHPYADGDEIRWRLVDGYTGEQLQPGE